MGSIIAFSGRMRSGKTELAKICERYGYERLYFALPLKNLCASLLGMTLDELNKAKSEGQEIGMVMGEDICARISQETEIPLDIVNGICKGVVIRDVRHMLQFIGTDLIRKYNMDWHVNRIRNMIDKNKNYVIDDVRFPNEKALIDELGGYCWFIVRPTLDNVSNHESETSITWNDCWNKIIINNSTLSSLLFKWETFMGNYEHSCMIREMEFNRMMEKGSCEEITPLSIYDILFISKDLFTYIPMTFDKEHIKNMSMNENKSLIVTYDDDTLEIIDNSLVIEEMKMLV